jgi:tetratricopeptide (TPR) repeat protein
MLRKTTLTFLGCLLLGVQAHSQKIDSLKNALLHQSGEERFSILYELVFEYLGKVDFPEALKYIEEAQQVAGRYDDSLHIVKAGRVKGQILFELHRIADAINEYQDVVLVSKRNNFNREYESILNALAVGYSLQAAYDKALQIHFECLELREKNGNLEAISATLNNIGFVYYKLNNYDKALEYYKRILDLSYEVSFKANLLLNIGLCYIDLRNFSTARKFIDAGLKVCAPNCSDLIVIQGKFALGVSLFYMKKPKEAEGYFAASYELAKKDKDKRFQIENLIYLGRISAVQGHPDDAKKFLRMAESVADETEYNELLINIYKQFSEVYTQAKEYENVTLYQGKYITLKDSLFSRELTKNLMRIQTEFEERENKAKIAAQSQILKLNEEAIDRQGSLNILMGTVAVLFIALVLILVRINRDKQKINSLLEQKVRERTQSLECSLVALQQSHTGLEEFILKTCKDIQSPVVTMRGLSNIMMADSDDPQTTRENVKHLERIITSLAELQCRLTELNEENHSKKMIKWS